VGHVKTSELDNGNIGLEITYGGRESPFGGVDTSAPPAYVDPRCFTASDGFIVVDNKLCLANWQAFVLPTIWEGNSATLLAIGTYFDSVQGQLNYALGVSITTPLGPPLIWSYKFYLTVWNPQGVIVDNVVLEPKLWYNNTIMSTASLTIPVLPGEASTFSDTGVLGLNYGASGILSGNVNVSYAPGDTVASKVIALAAAITAASASTHFTATPSADGFSIVLTAVSSGFSANALCVQDDSFSNVISTTPAFYLPISSTDWTFLSGGGAPLQAPPSSFKNVSAAFVGGVLYFGNLGPMILKYQALGQFNISTMYSGVTVLRKFAGSLIGLGVIPQLGTFTQNQNMIFAWSSAEDLDEWNPVNSVGNITGADFAELADIGDALRGLVVSNNTAFILRSQGISYATALGSGTDPFQFAHIGLGDVGEGAQDTALVCQYDQTGAYVGNTNIFQISGSISAIGEKIKQLLFALLDDISLNTGSLTCPIFVGGDIYPIVMFLVGEVTFVYNTNNGTWQTFSFTVPVSGNEVVCGIIADNVANSNLTSFQPVICYKNVFPNTIAASSFVEGGLVDIGAVPYSSCFFAQEEMLFGRDVTVDALYIGLFADVTVDTTVNFFFNGILFSTYILTPAQFNTLSGLPVEIQVFPTTTAGPFTVHSPQLQLQVVRVGIGASAFVRFTKIQWYGSFDAKQRPV
jgi:hypothetical protein